MLADQSSMMLSAPSTTNKLGDAGGLASIIRFLFPERESAAPAAGKVNVATFPARSVIVPPFSVSADESV